MDTVASILASRRRWTNCVVCGNRFEDRSFDGRGVTCSPGCRRVYRADYAQERRQEWNSKRDRSQPIQRCSKCHNEFPKEGRVRTCSSCRTTKKRKIVLPQCKTCGKEYTRSKGDTRGVYCQECMPAAKQKRIYDYYHNRVAEEGTRKWKKCEECKCAMKGFGTLCDFCLQMTTYTTTKRGIPMCTVCGCREEYSEGRCWKCQSR